MLASVNFASMTFRMSEAIPLPCRMSPTQNRSRKSSELAAKSLNRTTGSG